MSRLDDLLELRSIQREALLTVEPTHMAKLSEEYRATLAEIDELGGEGRVDDIDRLLESVLQP